MAAAHLAQTAKPFTLAVLPDTQFYCDTRLKLSAKWGNGDLRRYFFEQTRWVRDMVLNEQSGYGKKTEDKG